MDSPNDLLATLTQSSAVMVAIIGGFLVSRLVALSSEREGLRRQLRGAEDRLRLLEADYEEAHQHRLGWSQTYFEDLVLDKLIEEGYDDFEDLVEENVPRGSSLEEILPYAQELKDRVSAAQTAVEARLLPEDDSAVDLDHLKGRGLVVAERDEEIFEAVVYRVRTGLQTGNWMTSSMVMPPIQSAAAHATEARRFDEAVRDEFELKGQVTFTEQEVRRHVSELDRISRPVGVNAAVYMLAFLSLLGIVAPAVVMSLEPKSLSAPVKVALISAFVLGLVAVLAYVLWYLHALKFDDEGQASDD